jgi:hypothetical protein
MPLLHKMPKQMPLLPLQMLWALQSVLEWVHLALPLRQIPVQSLVLPQ